MAVVLVLQKARVFVLAVVLSALAALILLLWQYVEYVVRAGGLGHGLSSLQALVGVVALQQLVLLPFELAEHGRLDWSFGFGLRCRPLLACEADASAAAKSATLIGLTVFHCIRFLSIL